MSAALSLAVLVLLCAQNSAYTLLRRYSRGVLHEGASSSSVLMAAEGLKLCLSAILMTRPEGMPPDMPSGKGYLAERLAIGAFVLKHSMPMAIPAVTYLIMNMLSFKAMELVDATVFTMLAQLKIMSTAVFCWIVLGRRLSWPQWRAIILLTLAVSIITYERGAAVSHGDGAAPSSDNSKPSTLGFLLGVGMVVTEISLSGWISAYFEKYLKNGEFTVWARNLQLAMWSILVYGVIELVEMLTSLPDDLVAQSSTPPPAQGVHSVFATPLVGNWSIVTFALVLLGGGGGVLVAFAIKFADAVMKSMSTAFALVVVVTAEILFLGAPADPVVCLAGIIAILALQVYSEAPKVPEVVAPRSNAAGRVAVAYGCLSVEPEALPENKEPAAAA